MHFRIQLIAVADDGTEHREEIADLIRDETAIEATGLTLAESKQVLHDLQRTIVDHQVAGYLDAQHACPHCGKHRPLKAHGSAPFRTLFGVVSVPNPRWQHCACQPHTERTFRPLATLLPERTSPELRYLETKWAALVSYGVDPVWWTLEDWAQCAQMEVSRCPVLIPRIRPRFGPKPFD